jgi:hypothetical protein
MKSLQSDRQLREKMGIASRRSAEQHTWFSKSSEYLKFFDSIVNQ